MKDKLRSLIAANYFNPPNSLKQQLYRPLFWVGGKQLLVDRTLAFLSVDEMRNLEKMYALLANEQSKDLLLRLLASRALGDKGSPVLPLHGRFGEDTVAAVEQQCRIGNEVVEIGKQTLKTYDLSSIGVNMKISVPYFLGLYILNVIGQYHYREGGIEIDVNEGDIVIDLGGCWGDSALKFAERTGSSGKVYVYEFIPSNLEILKYNIGLNPELSSIVEVIERPVWSESDRPMYFTDWGPGSHVSFENQGGDKIPVHTLAVDDLVNNHALTKVDFIKMDIEGAEPYALAGAVNTIKAFRPKLAISIYHNMSDFSTIIHSIHAMDLGYTFYLGHYTDNRHETVLYAVAV